MTPEEARQQMNEWRVKTYMAQDDKTKQLIMLLEPDAQMAWLDANLILPADQPANQPPASQLTPQQQEIARAAGMSEEDYLKYSDRSRTIGQPQKPVAATETQPGQLTELERAMARNFNLTEAEYLAVKQKAGQ